MFKECFKHAYFHLPFLGGALEGALEGWGATLAILSHPVWSSAGAGGWELLLSAVLRGCRGAQVEAGLGTDGCPAPCPAVTPSGSRGPEQHGPTPSCPEQTAAEIKFTQP